MVHPRQAASILATSIFFIVIIASKARLATAGSGLVNALVRASGVICQEMPRRNDSPDDLRASGQVSEEPRAL
jgi:hypothetical protein